MTPLGINTPQRKQVVVVGSFFYFFVLRQRQTWGLQPPSAFVLPRKTPNTNNYDCSTTTATTSLFMSSPSSSSSIHQDEDGNCIFGLKSYWDNLYQGKLSDEESTTYKEDLRPSDSYSWYCGWLEIKPFWEMLMSSFKDNTAGNKPKILIAGIGNDPTPIDMYDDGWGSKSCQMIAYDYSEAGISRARELFGNDRMDHVQLIVADARYLPIEDGSIDATLDKGTFDAIYITGKDIFIDSIKELTRITAKDGIVMCISRVIDPDELIGAFDPKFWEIIHDGNLAFAPDGEATIDLGAELYSWKRI